MYYTDRKEFEKYNSKIFKHIARKKENVVELSLINKEFDEHKLNKLIGTLNDQYGGDAHAEIFVIRVGMLLKIYYWSNKKKAKEVRTILSNFVGEEVFTKVVSIEYTKLETLLFKEISKDIEIVLNKIVNSGCEVKVIKHQYDEQSITFSFIGNKEQIEAGEETLESIQMKYKEVLSNLSSGNTIFHSLK